jgi:uncharacterized membrane protein
MIHLFHPAVVHFPVALLVLGGLGEATGLLFRKEATERFGSVVVVLGLLTWIPALVTGYLAANTVPLEGEARRLLDMHELNGWLIGGWFFGCLFWKAWSQGEIPARFRPLYAAALLVGVALVVWGAWLGGEMVYGRGVGVMTR